MKGPPKDVRGLGGFIEAVMALMVVTLAVILLSTSLSFTGVQITKEGREDRTSDLATELTRTFKNDVMIWEGDLLVLSSFEARCVGPYDLPEGASGFRLGIYTNIDAKFPELSMSRGEEVDGTDIYRYEVPVAVKLTSGEVVPGVMEMEVW